MTKQLHEILGTDEQFCTYWINQVIVPDIENALKVSPVTVLDESDKPVLLRVRNPLKLAAGQACPKVY